MGLSFEPPVEHAQALTSGDLNTLLRCGIAPEHAQASSLFRVDSADGGRLIGRNGNGDYAGIVYPNIWPGETQPRAYTVRRDHPDLEMSKDGKVRERQKYLSEPGRMNRLYVPPGVSPEWLDDSSMSVIFVEGPKKAIALWATAWDELPDGAERPRYIVAAVTGVWNWRGTTGKAPGPDGSRRDVKGVIADFDRIPLTGGRRVTICFDANAATNDDVATARKAFARELTSRGATVFIAEIPQIDGVNGVDDLIGVWGQSRVRQLIESAQPEQGARPKIQSVAEIGSIRAYAAQRIEFLVDGIIAAGTVTLISGEPGCGKTTVATAICSAVERGVPFAGLKTQRRPVLVLDRENPISVVIERLDRLGVDDSENFTIWGGWAPEEAPAVQSPVVARFVESINAKPLILVDSLSAFHLGDENSATETREFFHGIRRLADQGATVVVLHHSGKADSASDYRGSSDIKASIDVGFKLSNLGDGGQLTTLRLKAFKARFTVQAETILHYNAGRFDVDNRPISRTNEEILRELLIANPGVLGSELRQLANNKGIKRNRVEELLKRWITNGNVRVENGQHNAKLHTWIGLSDAGNGEQF